MTFRVSSLWCVLALSCESGTAVELSVEVRTDFLPGVEFSAVSVEVEGRVEQMPAFRGEAWQEGRRIAELSGLAANANVELRTQLLGVDGSIVVERVMQVTIAEEDLSVTVIITRSCVGVVCPTTDPGATSCLGGRCVPPTCVTGAEPSCPAPVCTNSADCPAPPASCASTRCEVGICFAVPNDAMCPVGFCDPSIGCVAEIPRCSNEVQDEDETDTDCGGALCPACEGGASCLVSTDCQSGVCTGICAARTCEDQRRNGDETGVDCGGPCPGCAESEPCGDGSDCASGVCSDGSCVAPTCDDGVQNGDETDEDCGGAGCSPCVDDAACVLDRDCESVFCEGEVCAPVNNFWGDGSDGELHVTESMDIPCEQDGDMAVMQLTSLRIAAGATLTTASRCKGLLIYVDGIASIEGSLSMSARGAHVDPVAAGVPEAGLQLARVTAEGSESGTSELSGAGAAAIGAESNQVPLSANGTIFTIARQGAGGGPSVSVGSNAGADGMPGQSGDTMSGGGGSGSACSGPGGPSATSGGGAAGTCFSGGAGGAAAVQRNSNGGSAHGGPGGGANAFNDSAGGGAGNPGGGGAGGGSSGGTGTGGLLILIVRHDLTITATGSITANGVIGGGGQCAGGGSGGGNILILHAGTLTNDGLIEAAGGPTGPGANPGGPGGQGSTQLTQIRP